MARFPFHRLFSPRNSTLLCSRPPFQPFPSLPSPHFAEMQRLCVARHTLRRWSTPLRRVHVGQRHYAHTQSYNAAVIGAGITGLTTAYRLSQDPNCSHITLYEKSPEIGGSMKSEIIPVDGGHVVFEQGPRTLRATVPGSLPLMDLVPNTFCSSLFFSFFIVALIFF